MTLLWCCKNFELLGRVEQGSQSIFTVVITGRMRRDRSGRVRRMASRNYGGNGGHALIVVAQAAVQLN
jgi:hypothetical protein